MTPRHTAVMRCSTPVLLAVASFFPASCTTGPCHPSPAAHNQRSAEVAAALQRYQAAARTTDPDQIAAFYAPDGVLLEPGIAPIQGREAIRAFIASFPGVRVDVATATPEVIETWDNKALLWGSFYEKLGFPGQPDSEQNGKFVTEWVRQPDGAWLIQRFYRIPITTTEPPTGAAPPTAAEPPR